MARREELLEQLGETVFALMMEEVIRVEGRKALEENERLNADESFVVPEETYRKGLSTIKKCFSKNTRQTTMRTMSKLISRVAVFVLILLLLFTTAFATIPEFRATTMNLIAEVFDDRTRIGIRAVEQSETESDSLVGWVPEGFELMDKGRSDDAVWEKYGDSEGSSIEANICFQDSLIWELDTEEAEIKTIVVGEYSAMIIYKGELLQFVCPVKESNRVYYIRGVGICEETVLQMAKSMKIA